MGRDVYQISLKSCILIKDTSMASKHRLKASELIAILQKKIAKHGDLEIEVNTQDGASYSLYGEDDIKLMVGTRIVDNCEVCWLEIGA